MKKYQIIYADPPWQTGYVFGGKTVGSIGGGRKVPYPTMSNDEIMELPIKDIVDEDVFLFIWVIDSRIPIIEKLMLKWGFKYNSIGFIWNKRSIHFANKVRTTLTPYTRRSCEYCFLGLRGKTKHLVKNHYVLQYINEPIPDRRIHSSKPVKVKQLIVELAGNLPRIELFAREKTDGWDVWGNEVENDINLLKEKK